RRIAEETTAAPRHRIRWRRILVVAVPVAAAVAGAAILFPGAKSKPVAAPPEVTYRPPATRSAHAFNGVASSAAATAQSAPPAPNRGQRITTSLELRLPNTQAVSDATKQAVAITRALGGYPKALNVDAQGRTGYASLVLRIPKQNVQRAVSRLSDLGTIVGEN